MIKNFIKTFIILLFFLGIITVQTYSLNINIIPQIPQTNETISIQINNFSQENSGNYQVKILKKQNNNFITCDNCSILKSNLSINKNGILTNIAKISNTGEYKLCFKKNLDEICKTFKVKKNQTKIFINSKILQHFPNFINNFSAIKINNYGNITIGGISYLGKENSAIEIISNSGNFSCTKKIKGVFFISNKNNILYPLDENTLSKLKALYPKFNNINISGGLYTNCNNFSGVIGKIYIFYNNNLISTLIAGYDKNGILKNNSLKLINNSLLSGIIRTNTGIYGYIIPIGNEYYYFKIGITGDKDNYFYNTGENTFYLNSGIIFLKANYSGRLKLLINLSGLINDNLITTNSIIKNYNIFTSINKNSIQKLEYKLSTPFILLKTGYINFYFDTKSPTGGKILYPKNYQTYNILTSKVINFKIKNPDDYGANYTKNYFKIIKIINSGNDFQLKKIVDFSGNSGKIIINFDTGKYYLELWSKDKLNNSGLQDKKIIYIKYIPDLSPDSFVLGTVYNANTGQIYQSNIITVKGLTTGEKVLAYVTNGILFINGKPTISGYVKNGDTLRVELMAPLTTGAYNSSTLIINDKTSKFIVSTEKIPEIKDLSSISLKLLVKSAFLRLKQLYNNNPQKEIIVFYTLKRILEDKIETLQRKNNLDYKDKLVLSAFIYFDNLVEDYIYNKFYKKEHNIQIDNSRKKSIIIKNKKFTIIKDINKGGSIFIKEENKYFPTWEQAINYLKLKYNNPSILGEKDIIQTPNGKKYRIYFDPVKLMRTSNDMLYQKYFTTKEELIKYLIINNPPKGFWNHKRLDTTRHYITYISSKGNKYKIYRGFNNKGEKVYFSYNTVTPAYFYSLKDLLVYIETKENGNPQMITEEFITNLIKDENN